MSADATIKIDGIEDLQKIMKRMPENFNRNVLTAVARKAAKPLVEEARRLSPVSRISRVEWWGKRRKIEPGQMRKSITARKSNFDQPAGVGVGPSKKDGWWAHFVEFGTAGYTVKKGRNKGRFIPGQPAKSFMKRAFVITSNEIVSLYQENFKLILDKYIKKNKKIS